MPGGRVVLIVLVLALLWAVFVAYSWFGSEVSEPPAIETTPAP